MLKNYIKIILILTLNFNDKCDFILLRVFLDYMNTSNKIEPLLNHSKFLKI